MIALGIDASASALAVGLVADGQPLGEVRLLLPQAHNRAMLPVIRELLRRSGVHPRQLELVAVAAGPGSYTGLRLAATAGKVLAWAAGARVVGVDSLAVLAAGATAWAAAEGTPVAALLPARRGQLYGRLYGGGFPPAPCGDLLEGPEEEVVARLAAAAASPVLFVGEGALRARAAIAAAGGLLPADPSLHLPQGLLLARLGLEAAARGAAQDPVPFLPRYVGPPPAREPTPAPGAAPGAGPAWGR